MNYISGAVIIEGHVQGLSNVRALGEHGIPVYVIDVGSCLAQYSKYCKKFFKCPDYASKLFIDFLIRIGEHEKLEGWVLLPSNDHIVENVSHHKCELKPYYKTVVPDPPMLSNIINKNILLKIAKNCGTPIPGTCYPKEIENMAKLRFPVLIKGNKGLSFYKRMHVKAIKVDDIQSLKEHLDSDSLRGYLDNTMIQELIPYDNSHRVVSFTCFSEKGEIKTYWMGEKIREHPLKYGTATYSMSIFVNEVLDLSKPLIKALNYTGVCEIEFLWEPRDNVYKLIEINPRTWLWVGLAKSCGINYALIIYNYLNAIPNDFKTEYKIKLEWINWITDVFFSIKALAKGEISIMDYIKSLKKKKINAVFSWDDMIPGLIFPFLLFNINKNRG